MSFSDLASNYLGRKLELLRESMRIRGIDIHYNLHKCLCSFQTQCVVSGRGDAEDNKDRAAMLAQANMAPQQVLALFG